MSNLKTDKIDTAGASSLEIVKPLEVSSTCTITSTLTVEGDTVLGYVSSDTHTFTGDVDLNNDLNVDGSIVVAGALSVGGEVLNTSQGMEYIGTLSQTGWLNEIVIEEGTPFLADWSVYNNIRVVYVIASKNYTNSRYDVYLRRGASSWTVLDLPGQTQKSSSYSWDVISQECLDIRNTNTALGSTSVPMTTRLLNYDSGNYPYIHAPHGTIAGSTTHIEAIKFTSPTAAERLKGYFSLWGIRN